MARTTPVGDGVTGSRPANREPRVLILSTIPRFTIHLVRAAALCRCRPYVVADRPWALDRLSIHARRRLVVKRAALTRGDPQAFLEINRFIESNRIDVVVPADTRCTRMLTRHGGAVQGAALFPLPTAELFDRLNDKWSFYQLLVELGVPTPRSLLACAPEEVEAADLALPVVVKPRRAEGGVGVRRFECRDALLQHLRTLSEQGRPPVIVQEWAGSCDAGLALCADRGELSSWLVQRREGDGIRFIDDDRVVELGRKICRAVGYHGVAHIDIRHEERSGTVKVLEFNPRFWASLNHSSWMGVNFLAAGLAILGQARPRGAFTPVSGKCPYLASTPGTLARWILNGFESPASTPAQRRAWLLQMGDPLPEWVDWAVGHLRSAARAGRAP